MNYIWIIRHGKSAEGGPGLSDFERPLSRRGVGDGEVMQAWFAQQDHRAVWVWTSTALRARTTATFVTAGFDATCVEQPALYLAGPDTLLDCLRASPADVRSVALVAHNPGLTDLVNLLGRGPVTDNLVTFGTALFSTEREWVDLSFGSAQLLGLHAPKAL